MNQTDFTRYLAAKKTVDDRALNKDVWQVFRRHLPPQPHILEIGAGIGTMLERLREHEMISGATYTAIDNQPGNTAVARQRLRRLPTDIRLELETIDLFDFITRENGSRTWDVLIAHAFLDLMDIPATLPQLLSLLRPGGLCYFTINFDGATILEPAIDPELDAQIETLYHQTMDERVINGQPSGDSRSGRHLFHCLRQAGVDILAAGSSDWVVFAGPDGYPADEAAFLRFIINTIENALQGHPGLDNGRFTQWISQRHAQIDSGELVYIAHQLDFLGQLPSH